jgi:hypothetical protein
VALPPPPPPHPPPHPPLPVAPCVHLAQRVTFLNGGESAFSILLRHCAAVMRRVSVLACCTPTVPMNPRHPACRTVLPTVCSNSPAVDRLERLTPPRTIASACLSSEIIRMGGSRSAPTITPPKMVFLNSFNRLRYMSPGSRFGADPHSNVPEGAVASEIVAGGGREHSFR